MWKFLKLGREKWEEDNTWTFWQCKKLVPGITTFVQPKQNTPSMGNLCPARGHPCGAVCRDILGACGTLYFLKWVGGWLGATEALTDGLLKQSRVPHREWKTPSVGRSLGLIQIKSIWCLAESLHFNCDCSSIDLLSFPSFFFFFFFPIWNSVNRILDTELLIYVQIFLLLPYSSLPLSQKWHLNSNVNTSCK